MRKTGWSSRWAWPKVPRWALVGIIILLPPYFALEVNDRFGYIIGVAFLAIYFLVLDLIEKEDRR